MGDVASPADRRVHDGLPPWVPSLRECGGHPREAACRLVVQASEAIQGGPVNPLRCKAAALSVLALWKGLGYPDPEELAEEIALVVRWARLSPDGLAENDIRGVRASGQRWGTDRSGDLSTLCVQTKWDVRLRAARSWDEAGSREAAAPGPPLPDVREAEAAWGVFERVAARVTRGDEIPAGASPLEARVLDVFRRSVGWGRWWDRTAQNKGELRQRFLTAWQPPQRQGATG